MPDDNSAVGKTAKLEENEAPHKVIVNSRPRVTKPETTGNEPAEDIDTKPGKDKKTIGISEFKSSKLKPDIYLKEAEPDKPDDDTPPNPEDSQIDSELAQAGADKKTDQTPPPDSAQDKTTQALIENKTYFVPVGQVTKRRNTKIFVIILLIILLVAAAGLVMAY